MTETWLKNLKSGCGAAQRPHESKMIAVSSPDHRFLTFGELAIYVRFTPDTVAKLRLRKNGAILIRRRTHLGKNESFST